MRINNYLKRFIPILGLNSSYIRFKIKILKKLYNPNLCIDWWMVDYFEKEVDIDKYQIDLVLASKEAEEMIGSKVEENIKRLREYANKYKQVRCMVTMVPKQSKT